ncbi:MAG: MBL fold metallo-hydrolase [Chloroflexi bacterium]|nr:MBL fold metallo-hydrolase [Chloroflexota bacterium]
MADNFVTFLGTAGARIVMAKQLLASGGMWFNLGGVQILIDPGPGCLVHAVKKKLDPTKLSAIMLSHKHLDHCGDISVMIEAMTEGGFVKRGAVFVPEDALENDPVILKYLRGFPRQIVVLKETQSYRVDGIPFETSVRHKHGVETYGLILKLPEITLSYIPDTVYFPELPSSYSGDVLIINVVRFASADNLMHLSIPNVKELLRQVKPRAAILTHFGMTMWKARPWEVAEQVTQETGIKVVAARDGQTIDLNQLASRGQTQET